MKLLQEQQLTSPTLSEKIAQAERLIKEKRRVLVALSAGVDSSLVALLAYQVLHGNAVAVTAESPSLPPGELEVAKRVAKEIGIKHVVIKTDEVSDPNYFTNPTNRCYYCKKTLYSELTAMARREGFETTIDGTIRDDLNTYRPGLAAAKEFGVFSPLAEAGFTKEDVRTAARMFGLSVHDKPAMACLSSRIPYGQLITLEGLNRIGEAERFIKKLTGIRQLRVRNRSGDACIEVSPEEMSKVASSETIQSIAARLLELGFENVMLDLRGYRTGSLNEQIRR